MLYWLTEVGAHKTFSMEVTSELEWVRNTLKNLIATPSIIRFFLETRNEDHCLWIRKTKNSKGYTTKIYRVDYVGRKACILVPEGIDTSDWVSFLSTITPKVEVEAKTTPSFTPKGTLDSTPRRSYAKAVSKGISWWLTTIYDPARRRNPDLFWENLHKLNSLNNSL